MNAELLVESSQRVWPEKITTDWRRFSSGLWRVPEGDISEAYSASTLPKVAVFFHDGSLFTNCGACYSKAVSTLVDAYPLIPANEYHGPNSRPYSYEGNEVRYHGKPYRLGTKVIFASSDPTVEEWRQILRVQYADGGYFARQDTYGLFLSEDHRNEQSPNSQVALELEQEGAYLRYTKEEMKQFLNGATVSQSNQKLQLDLAL